ncbi:hypothetical protein GYH30_010188 [Glycine max]|nr:hypothetical protein GYH30_010188 [Glycine max]
MSSRCKSAIIAEQASLSQEKYRKERRARRGEKRRTRKRERGHDDGGRVNGSVAARVK